MMQPGKWYRIKSTVNIVFYVYKIVGEGAKVLLRQEPRGFSYDILPKGFPRIEEMTKIYSNEKHRVITFILKG